MDGVSVSREQHDPVLVCMYLFTKLHITGHPGPAIIISQCYRYVSMHLGYYI